MPSDPGSEIAKAVSAGVNVTRSTKKGQTVAAGRSASASTYVGPVALKRKEIVYPAAEGGPSLKEIAVDPLRVKVAVVTEAFGSKSKAAEYLGVARSQPGKWLAGVERPNPRARRLIQDFEYVWDRLTDERTPETATLWLTSPNSFLNGATPMTWLKSRGAEDVVGAIDAEEAGSFA